VISEVVHDSTLHNLFPCDLFLFQLHRLLRTGEQKTGAVPWTKLYGLKERTIMKVLVVDDNRLLADTIQEILENDGLDVMSAKDGLDGYSTYLLFKPDMIITDIQMPRKNGMEMMKRIRIHNPMIKTIYMSGNIGSFETFLIEEKKRYPVSYFEKPFSWESLMRVVTEPTVN
jgi:DNA-binding NtrC family response regulator